MIKIKRAYSSPSPTDGFRILVDRLWPRGLTKAKAKIDLWLKDLAPSNELRHQYHHDPSKWPAFRTNYQKELDQKEELLDQIKRLEKQHKVVTLVFASKEERLNNAVVLLARLKSR